MVEKINLFYMFSLINNTDMTVIEYLQEKKLLSESYKCSVCGKVMRLSKKNTSDGYVWICKTRKAGQEHNIKRSIRKGTWFENSKMTIKQILLLTYFWVHNYSQKNVIHEMKISAATSVDWYNFCREVCVDLIMSRKKKIGGDKKIVEIKESKFGKLKHHRGRRVEGQWVLGGICQNTKDCFFATMPIRDTSTLLAIIKDNVEPGTTLYSDCWKTYDCLQTEELQQLAINQTITFKEPDTVCQVNTFDHLCSQVKRGLPRRNQNIPIFDSYLAEYLYRIELKTANDKYLQFLKDLAELYKPQKED